MYFKGWLFSVGLHITADVPRSGLSGAEPGDDEEKKGGRGEQRLTAAILP